MNRITNKQIIEKLDTIQNNISHEKIFEKMDALQYTVNNLQNNVDDKATLMRLANENKKSSVMIYAGLSIMYLGIGLALLISSLQLIAIQYSIIFGVFFAGSIILAYLAYTRKKMKIV